MVFSNCYLRQEIKRRFTTLTDFTQIKLSIKPKDDLVTR